MSTFDGIALQTMRSHLATFKKFPAKKVMGIKVVGKCA